MNKVILMGRFTRDPEVRYSQGETSMAVARYTLAVDCKGKRDSDQQSADFISCVAFGKAGELAEKWLWKGIKIAVIGRIQTGSYTNREGQKVYTTDVVGAGVRGMQGGKRGKRSELAETAGAERRRWLYEYSGRR